MTKEEVWKDIPEYEGLYQASNYGRVKSIERVVLDGRGRELKRKSVILSSAINTAGYKTVVLYKDFKKHSIRVHQLIARTFIPNPDNLSCINHKDENKLNNHVDNLEWCSYSYNTIYNNAMRRRLDTRNINNSHGKERKVYQYDLQGNLLKEWDSLSSISKELGYSFGNIAKCCNGGKYRHTAYGYKWFYELLNNSNNES